MDQARRAFLGAKRLVVVGSMTLWAGVVVLAALAGVVVLAARPASAQPAPAAPISPGYWLMASDGGVYQFGTTNFGSLRGHILNQPIVGTAALQDGLGYWMVAADGGVFAFGAAGFDGSTGGVHLNQPIVGMAATPNGEGYWLVAADGGIFTFGDAGFYGSTGGVHLNQPVVGMAATTDGKGYWLVARDGGIFSFGDAGFYGSTGGIRLNQPVVGMAATSDGKGYWLVARDGGIFTFGDAGFHGSTGGIRLDQPVVAMAATSNGAGYWLVASDGGIFTFGDAPFLGSTGADPGPAPIVGIAAAHGYPFPPGALGNDISQFQCPGFPYYGTIPPTPQGVAVVQVSGGAIDASPNPCYQAEASWAGSNVSAYIFMDGLPSPAPPVSESGPAGTCNGNVSCESYNFGWYWARNWVAYSRNLGVEPWLWWLDVETDGAWNGGPAGQASNAEVISGAYAGLRSSGVVPGIYSTAYQWGKVAGSLAFPNVPLWVPGAGNISGGAFSAQNFCAGTIPAPYGPLYEPFADGIVTLVQYGSAGNGYTGPASRYDQDYSCL